MVLLYTRQHIESQCVVRVSTRPIELHGHRKKGCCHDAVVCFWFPVFEINNCFALISLIVSYQHNANIKIALLTTMQ